MSRGAIAFYRVGGAILLIFNPNATEKGSSGGKLPVPTHGARGPGHLCFAASREEMQAWSARLTAAGHPIESAFEWPNGAYSIYFRDPAGNSLEFAEPRPLVLTPSKPQLVAHEGQRHRNPSGAMPWPVPFMTWA